VDGVARPANRECRQFAVCDRLPRDSKDAPFLAAVLASRSGIVLMANCNHLSSIKSIFAAAMGSFAHRHHWSGY
jgi:hypothetical protein